MEQRLDREGIGADKKSHLSKNNQKGNGIEVSVQDRKRDIFDQVANAKNTQQQLDQAGHEDRGEDQGEDQRNLLGRRAGQRRHLYHTPDQHRQDHGQGKFGAGYLGRGAACQGPGNTGKDSTIDPGLGRHGRIPGPKGGKRQQAAGDGHRQGDNRRGNTSDQIPL